MLHLAPHGSNPAGHHRPEVQQNNCGAEEDFSCRCLAAALPSTRARGRVVWDLLVGLGFFFMLPPSCLQAAKIREKLSCITDGSGTSWALRRLGEYQEKEESGRRRDISLNGKKEMEDGSGKLITARGKWGAGTVVDT